MITFNNVTKTYPNGTVAADNVSFSINEGEVMVLVGPSGCGKTTMMRMINHMVAPSSGTITVAGNDVSTVNEAELRRGIGYVIQQTGLFPHRTVAENIATVPVLAGWDARDTADRVTELIDTVGLPDTAADRYPHQLSGGQRQRVGVARALAADPPVLLMDEPFGAVDPIVRAHLQQEFLSLQRRVHKTIVFVTHDIEEAITMGDRIAIFAEGGVLQQLDTPMNVLAEPANDFVKTFLGEERGLRRLGLIAVKAVPAKHGAVVTPTVSRAVAAVRADRENTDWVTITDDDNVLLGWAFVDDLSDPVAVSDARPFEATVHADDTLRAAVDTLVSSHHGVAVRLGPTGTYEGYVTRESVTGALA